MAIEADLRAYLLTSADVANLVGDRIRPDLLSEHDADPALTIVVEDEEQLDDLSGTCELVRADIRVNAVSRNKATARDLADKCRLALQGYTGPAGGLSKIDVVMDGAQTQRFQADDGSNEGEYVVEQRYTVLYPQVAATF